MNGTAFRNPENFLTVQTLRAFFRVDCPYSFDFVFAVDDPRYMSERFSLLQPKTELERKSGRRPIQNPSLRLFAQRELRKLQLKTPEPADLRNAKNLCKLFA